MHHGVTKRKRRPKSGKRPDTKRIARTMAFLRGRKIDDAVRDSLIFVMLPSFGAVEPKAAITPGTVSEKEFPLAAVLTLTTGYTLCDLDSIYDILDFMTGERPTTFQIPRFMDECEPTLRQQFPNLYPGSPAMREAIAGLEKLIELDGNDQAAVEMTCRHWVDAVRTKCAQFPDILPETLTVRSLPAGQHKETTDYQQEYADMRKAALARAGN